MDVKVVVPATARMRVVAFAWDYLLIAIYAAVLAAVSQFVWLLILRGQVPATATNPVFYDLLAFLTLVLPVILYFAAGEASASGGTWGKRRMKISVLSIDGGNLSMQRSLARSALKFLPWQIAHSALFHVPGWPVAPEPVPPLSIAGFVISFLLVATYLVGLFRRDRRTLYDYAARSHVVVASDGR